MNNGVEEKRSDEIVSNEVTVFSLFSTQRSTDAEKQRFQIHMGKELHKKINTLCKNDSLYGFTLLMGAFTLLCHKFTGNRKMVLSTPAYFVAKDELPAADTNEVVSCFYTMDSGMDVPTYLEDIKSSIIRSDKTQRDPVHDDLLPDEDNRAHVPQIFILQENIHPNVNVEDVVKSDRNDLHIILREGKNTFEIEVINSNTPLSSNSIAILTESYLQILRTMIGNPDIKLRNIELIGPRKRNTLIKKWCEGGQSVEVEESLGELFSSVVKKYGDKIAVSECVNLYNIDRQISYDHENITDEKIKKYCFEKSPFLLSRKKEIHVGDQGSTDKVHYFIVKSVKNDNLIVNENTMTLLDMFESTNNAISIYNSINKNIEFFLCRVNIEEPEVMRVYANEGQIYRVNSFNDFIEITKVLLDNNMIKLSGYNERINSIESTAFIGGAQSEAYTMILQSLTEYTDLKKAEVLLLGDKPGICAVGLLYLSSYLRRNGVSACCQFYDNGWNEELLRKNITYLLDRIQPKIVGVSMKWFPHIARCLEICKMIKEYSAQIKTVVGGDTASFYHEEVIENDCVDYIIIGDGEYPLLSICKGYEDIPNCVYKKENKVYKTPVSFKKDDTTSKEIYLSHLEDVLISDAYFYMTPIYIHTHKVCSMNCFFCGGCKRVAKKTYHNNYTKWRSVENVRNDILEVKDKSGVFMFEFGYKPNKIFEYCSKIWEGMDLSENYCAIYSINLPSRKLLELVCSTFKYVRWNVDICSLSESHRNKMIESNYIKPLPSNKEIIEFFENCSEYKNIEVDINLIAGLPFYDSQDIKESEEFLDYITKRYSCFNDILWGKLYAEPGSLISENAGQFEMYSYARSYSDFYQLSIKNYNHKPNYPVLRDYNYPYIYYKDNNRNIEIYNHFNNLHKKVSEYHANHSSKVVEHDYITYNMLDKLSDTLACEIQTKAKEGSIIAITAKRKIKLTIAILAAIKCGIQYVVLEDKFPEERINYVLNDSNADLLLTESITERYNRLPHKRICMDDVLNNTAECAFKTARSSKESCLYLIYTSGSTGEPKGVAIRQKGVINYIKWRMLNYNINSNDVTLQLLSESFDGFYSNFFSSLLSGGKLMFIESDNYSSLKSAKEVINKYNVTNLSVVPSMYGIILDFCNNNDLKSLRFVVLGGEKADEGIVIKSRKLSPETVLINEYGMTENSITSSVNIGITEKNVNVIGKPISNSSMYILNDDDNIMPVGVQGEICVTGIGLAEGYNNSLLTQQKFIKNPYNEKQILYKTGDIGALLPDGNFLFLHRKDNQINLRGYRIEPGEIEYNLRKCEGIEEAHIVYNNKDLIAYVKTNTPMDVNAIRSQLLDKIPEYMMPTYFQEIHDDLTANTVNGNKLNTPYYNTNETASSDEVELFIYNLWKSLLDHNEEIGLNKNFFTIGGNSMLLMKVFTEIERKYPGYVAIPDLFIYTTISKLADFIKDKISKQPA